MPIDRKGGQKRPEKASVNIFCAREKVSIKGITGSAIHWVLGTSGIIKLSCKSWSTPSPKFCMPANLFAKLCCLNALEV